MGRDILTCTNCGFQWEAGDNVETIHTHVDKLDVSVYLCNDCTEGAKARENKSMLLGLTDSESKSMTDEDLDQKVKDEIKEVASIEPNMQIFRFLMRKAAQKRDEAKADAKKLRKHLKAIKAADSKKAKRRRALALELAAGAINSSSSSSSDA